MSKGIAVAGLEHAFPARGGAVAALGRIDLDIAPGELVTLAGPSGCGKTTLLRMIAGFASPSTGSITVGGVPVTGPGVERGVVFQQPNLYPWLDVRRNVALGPRLRGVGRAERLAIADRYLDLVGLGDAADRRPYELSGGMQQRAQIARVLAGDPEVILMDEPYGALDALTRERLQGELLSLWRATGKTILFITHSVDEAVFLGSRVLVMSPRPGRIVLDELVPFSADPDLAPDEIRALPKFGATAARVRAAIAH
ncbi:ABC transporter ATP-binding protein [Pimelobacter simplex]|uniref:ABC transporter ATP-binding protein n=1 Tax=Nocardioides simplex TaxID=2045 RepID=A0A7J5DWC2_NOCSI|nr:ABC transporter ATP-binding protein [Pimelobacter simplex]KAB2809601.1 ABC transporter ATP-binding protein [Pimelobacter simplex]